jgi:hypothetical protein
MMDDFIAGRRANPIGNTLVGIPVQWAKRWGLGVNHLLFVRCQFPCNEKDRTKGEVPMFDLTPFSRSWCAKNRIQTDELSHKSCLGYKK